MIQIDNIKDLGTIEDSIRMVINDHLSDTGKTATGFANEVGVHPLQMLGFLKGERGLNIQTITRIGKNVST